MTKDAEKMSVVVALGRKNNKTLARVFNQINPLVQSWSFVKKITGSFQEW